MARSALFLNCNIGLIAVANMVYMSWLLGVPLRQLSPGWMLASTFLVGFFPAAGVTATTYIRQLRRHQAGAAMLSNQLVALPPEASAPLSTDAHSAALPVPPRPVAAAVTFTAENGKDTLTVPRADVLYLEAADNYCTVVHGPSGTPSARALFRASLSRLASQADAQGAARFARVHRSYLVNLDRVLRISGNAQGYRLHLPADVEPVPVGRTYAEAVLTELRPPAVRP